MTKNPFKLLTLWWNWIWLLWIRSMNHHRNVISHSRPCSQQYKHAPKYLPFHFTYIFHKLSACSPFLVLLCALSSAPHIATCVNILYITQFQLGCTVRNSLPLARLLGFILRTPLYPFFHSSLALTPRSSVCVTSRIIPILSFFSVAHRLRASITVCNPPSVSKCAAIYPFGGSKSVCCPLELIHSFVLWPRKGNNSLANAAILSAFLSLYTHPTALNIKRIYCAMCMCVNKA